MSFLQSQLLWFVLLKIPEFIFRQDENDSTHELIETLLDMIAVVFWPMAGVELNFLLVSASNFVDGEIVVLIVVSLNLINMFDTAFIVEPLSKENSINRA